MDIGDFNKECVKSRLRDSAYSSFKQVSRISDKNLSREDVKPLNNLVKNKGLVIQKAGKGNNIFVLNRSDCISKFRIVNIEEGKALNHSIHMEERIICQKFRRSR